MLLFLRKLKQGHFMNQKFRKYLLYAVGEMVLVIIGILIALQIDNWNSERQQEELLRSYLQSIARNMQDDAAELEELRSARLARALDAQRAESIAGRLEGSFNVAEIFFFNKVVQDASENLYFKSNTSGYEALKSSGLMSRLQGRDIEALLSRYYDQVSRIEDLETQHSGLVNSFNLQFLLSHPDDLPQWQFMRPRALPPELFEALQPQFSMIINSPAARELIRMHIGGGRGVCRGGVVCRFGTGVGGSPLRLLQRVCA